MSIAAVTPPAHWSFYHSEIVDHQQVAQSTWQVGLRCPELARVMIPGQFAMLRLANRQDAILGRAFAMWDRFGTTDSLAGVQFVYMAKGRMTTPLATMPIGTKIDVWGPLGNGFRNEPVDHLVLVAGGVGQTPMLTLAQEALGLQSFGTPNRSNAYAKKVTLCYGARTAAYLAGLPKFTATGANILLATEDGSAGVQGRVTLPLEQVLASKPPGESMRICVCGPEPMMEAVSELALRYEVACEVSLETPMACGIGICYSCVAKIVQEDGQWDYRRTCMEGPVFDARRICW